jgi:hypothetical protein
MRFSLFWHVTKHVAKRRLVVTYGRFGKTISGYIFKDRTAWPLQMGPIVCPETSVNNYQSILHNVPEG